MTCIDPFGPLSISLAQPDCPDCSCCKKPLCEKGKEAPTGCISYLDVRRADDTCANAVRRCPCSAATTHGTVAYHSAQVLAAWHAKENPLKEEEEKSLRAISDGETTRVKNLTVLKSWCYIVTNGGEVSISDAGKAYLTNRNDIS